MTGTSRENAVIKTARFMARADVFSWALLWLMGLLVAGTVSEKAIGLYMAQKIYFSSAIFWLGGFIPLPGVLLTSAFIFTGMVCKLAQDKWRKADLGTIVIHIGAGLLLAGGFITAQYSTGGNMVIPQGESRSFIESDDQVELAVIETAGGEEMVFPANELWPETTLQGKFPFKIDVGSWCRNCGLQRLKMPATQGDPHGVAINFKLKEVPRNPVEEDNRAGLTFQLRDAGESNGMYAIFEGMPIPEIVSIKGKKYLFVMRHVRTELPFSVKLLRFGRELYPGTDKARSYESEVILQDRDTQWHSVIRMNEPLRYKGYVFYQASFLEGAPKQTTILAVVNNVGRSFPYISSIVICVGMLIHLFQKLPTVLRERRAT